MERGYGGRTFPQKGFPPIVTYKPAVRVLPLFGSFCFLFKEHFSQVDKVKDICFCIGDDISGICLLACEFCSAEDIFLHEQSVGNVNLAVEVDIALSAECGCRFSLYRTDDDIAHIDSLVLGAEIYCKLAVGNLDISAYCGLVGRCILYDNGFVSLAEICISCRIL